MLATDGRNLYFVEENHTLRSLTENGQLTFAFVLDVAAVQSEVKSRLSESQMKYYSLSNRRLRYA